MERTVPPVSLDSLSSVSPFERQKAQRVQYVVAQVISTHSGSPENEVARILTQRLRGLGVNPSVRETQNLAEIISRLPKT